MSIQRTCPDCGQDYEEGIQGSGGPCDDCEAREDRLASGGLPITGSERAALAEFLGLVVPREELPHGIEARFNALVIDDGQCTDFATITGERAFITPASIVNRLAEEASRSLEDLKAVRNTKLDRELDVVEVTDEMVAFQDGPVRMETNRESAERRLEDGDLEKVV